jgi:hypothetical protein
VDWTAVQDEDDMPAAVEITRTSHAVLWDTISQDMRNVGNVTSIVRCEHYELWESFVREKKTVVKRMARRGGWDGRWTTGGGCRYSGAGASDTVWDMSTTADVHERLLFHTARAPVETIFEEGFDTRLSSPGNFGRGIYFSDDPVKCDWYWRGGTGSRVMFVAQVVLGDAKVYPRGQNDQRLTREPERNPSAMEGHQGRPAGAHAAQRHSTDRYDSVRGHISTADEFVVYQNARAFPMYAVHYTPSASSRVPALMSRAAASSARPVGRPEDAAAVAAASRRAAAAALAAADTRRREAEAEAEEQRELERALAISLRNKTHGADERQEMEEVELAAALEMSLASSAVPAPTQPAFSADDVSELVEWGFSEEDVRRMLEATGGDKDAAANLLLGELGG